MSSRRLRHLLSPILKRWGSLTAESSCPLRPEDKDNFHDCQHRPQLNDSHPDSHSLDESGTDEEAAIQLRGDKHSKAAGASSGSAEESGQKAELPETCDPSRSRMMLCHQHRSYSDAPMMCRGNVRDRHQVKRSVDTTRQSSRSSLYQESLSKDEARKRMLAWSKTTRLRKSCVHQVRQDGGGNTKHFSDLDTTHNVAFTKSTS